MQHSKIIIEETSKFLAYLRRYTRDWFMTREKKSPLLKVPPCLNIHFGTLCQTPNRGQKLAVTDLCTHTRGSTFVVGHLNSSMSSTKPDATLQGWCHKTLTSLSIWVWRTWKFMTSMSLRALWELKRRTHRNSLATHKRNPCLSVNTNHSTAEKYNPVSHIAVCREASSELMCSRHTEMHMNKNVDRLKACGMYDGFLLPVPDPKAKYYWKLAGQQKNYFQVSLLSHIPVSSSRPRHSPETSFTCPDVLGRPKKNELGEVSPW